MPVRATLVVLLYNPLLLLYYNFLFFISRVYNYFVVPASVTGMAYIQRDHRGGIAASMRRRLREMGTER